MYLVNELQTSWYQYEDSAAGELFEKIVDLETILMKK